MKLHFFEFTGEAYDATQCDEDIKTGDVLVCLDEGVIGLADCWPVAITQAFGKLHTLKPDGSGSIEKDRTTYAIECPDKRRAIAALVKGYGLELTPIWERLLSTTDEA